MPWKLVRVSLPVSYWSALIKIACICQSVLWSSSVVTPKSNSLEVCFIFTHIIFLSSFVCYCCCQSRRLRNGFQLIRRRFVLVNSERDNECVCDHLILFPNVHYQKSAWPQTAFQLTLHFSFMLTESQLPPS